MIGRHNLQLSKFKIGNALKIRMGALVEVYASLQVEHKPLVQRYAQCLPLNHFVEYTLRLCGQYEVKNEVDDLNRESVLYKLLKALCIKYDISQEKLAFRSKIMIEHIFPC